MNKKQTHTIATLISRIFDPFVTVGLVSTIAVFISGLNGLPLFFYLVVIVFGTIALLATLLHWAIRRGHLSNWDLTDRKQRFIPLAVALVVLTLNLIASRFFINDFLVNLFALYISWMIGFFLITLFWKISGHAAGTTLAAGLIIHWFGWSSWPVLLAIPLVGWARVVRKDHSVYQVVAGSFYSVVILALLQQY